VRGSDTLQSQNRTLTLPSPLDRERRIHALDQSQAQQYATLPALPRSGDFRVAWVSLEFAGIVKSASLKHDSMALASSSFSRRAGQ